MTIVFFGASTVEGVRDSVWGGFVTRLANRAFTERKRARIFNLGIAGDTSREYVNRTEEIAARRADHVVFLLGCNEMAIPRSGSLSKSMRRTSEGFLAPQSAGGR